MKAFYFVFLLLLLAISVNSWRRRRQGFKYEKKDTLEERDLARKAFFLILHYYT